MKINLHKVIAIVSSVIMLGSTIGFAAAAWDPFVKNGLGDAAIVVGAGSAITDMVAATDLGIVLNTQVTNGLDIIGGGDSIKLEKSTNLFNLGDNIKSFYPTLDSGELNKVLADEVYSNDNNDEYEYEQAIALGSMILAQSQDDDFNDGNPFIGFDLTSSQPVFNYTLDFNEDVDGGTKFVNLETTNIEMLGRNYYIVDADGTSNGVELTLLDSANSDIISEGEISSIIVGNKIYSVEINFVDDTDVILTVDGVKTNKLGEGDVFKVATDTYVSIKSILYSEKESGTSKVEISIGSGKIVLENGQEVEINGKKISESTDQIVNSYITNSSTDISQIKLEWILDDDFILAQGSDLIMPGFETVKLSMTGFNMPKQEVTTLKTDGDNFMINTEITDGKIKLPILYMNSSTTGIGGYGADDDELLVINTTADPTVSLSKDSSFVATWIDGDDYESYVFELSSIEDADGKNATTLKNLADKSTIKFSEVTDDADKGNINFVLVDANEKNDNASIKLSSATTSGIVYTDRIITKEGMQIMLPTNATNSLLSANAITANMNITEEDNNGNIASGSSLLTTITIDDGDGAEVTTISPDTKYETEDDSEVYEDYLVSKLGTKIIWDKSSNDLNTLDLIYAGEESSADVYISEDSTSFADSSSIKVITDNEVDSAKDKNLIVIGGSCINKVAAMILTGKTDAVCGDAFTSLTGVGANKQLIQVASSPYNTAKIAMLVAGYDAADTTLAVTKVKEGTVSTDIGTKLIA